LTTPTNVNSADTALHGDLFARLEPSGWARVERVQLIRREVREFLSPQALDLMFERAERVIEGGRDELGRVYATVMLSVDLDKCQPWFRERADAATAQRVVELLRNDRWLERHLRRHAREALSTQSGRRVAARRVALDYQVRARDRHLLVDCDAMLSNEDVGGRGP